VGRKTSAPSSPGRNSPTKSARDGLLRPPVSSAGFTSTPQAREVGPRTRRRGPRRWREPSPPAYIDSVGRARTSHPALSQRPRWTPNCQRWRFDSPRFVTVRAMLGSARRRRGGGLRRRPPAQRGRARPGPRRRTARWRRPRHRPQQQRIFAAGIYTAGDVTGPPWLTNRAVAAGTVAGGNVPGEPDRSAASACLGR
jgi:hypothetical protein